MSHRIISTEQTFSNIKEKINEVGISRISDLSYLDDASKIKVYSAIRPNSKSLCVSMGKGLDDMSAKVGACMESIEAYYTENMTDSAYIYSYNDLASQKIPFLKIENYLKLDSLSPEYKLPWYKGKLLCRGTDYYIPKPLLSLDSNEIDSYLFGATSKGLASGNSIDEAIFYSFLELVERDAVENNALSLINISNDNLKEVCLSDHLELRLFQLKNSYELPVILAIIQDKNPLFNKVNFKGVACHFDKSQALRGAILEALQSKIGVISGARDDLKQEQYIYSKKEKNYRDFNEVNYEDINTLNIDCGLQLKYIKSLLEKQNIDLLYYVYHSSKISVLKSFLI